MAQTDDDIRGQYQTATSFRVHVALPPRPADITIAQHARRCVERVQTLCEFYGVDAYSIAEIHGCWKHQREPGLVIERIYPGCRVYPDGLAIVAKALKEEWHQEEVWITRFDIGKVVV